MNPDASRTWFLTWTTYGTWLPGDRRGFVGAVREVESGLKILRNDPAVPHEGPVPSLESAARARMRADAVRIRPEQAVVIADQFAETAAHRGWTFHALAVMSNHIHVVVTAAGDPDPESLLRDLKAYASRALSARFGRPAGGTWWTRSGSKRKCADPDSLMTRVRYVREQPGALVIRLHSEYQAL